MPSGPSTRSVTLACLPHGADARHGRPPTSNAARADRDQRGQAARRYTRLSRRDPCVQPVNQDRALGAELRAHACAEGASRGATQLRDGAGSFSSMMASQS